MTNLEKTHEYLKNKKKKLLLHLQRIKKKKIIEELANVIEKCIDILIWADKKISRKKSWLGKISRKKSWLGVRLKF
jgi:hypothetical protein